LDFHIRLQVLGKEKSRIVHTTKARTAERRLFFHQQTIHHVLPSEVWDPRVHEFSFQMDIPTDMPASLRCDDGLSYAEMTYRVRAFLEGPSERSNTSSSSGRQSSSSRLLKSISDRSAGRSVRSILKTMSDVRTIALKAAPIPPIVVPYIMQPTQHEIKTFGVKSKGHIMFGVSVADTHVGPGETLEICVAAHNQSGVDIENVYIKLVETISWNLDASDQVRSVERVLLKQNEPMHIPKQDNLSFLSSIDHSEDFFISLYAELQSRKNIFRVQVPSSGEMNDDYAGPLVKCSHHLEIRIKSETYVDDPRAQIPLQLKQFVSHEDAPARVETRFLTMLDQMEESNVHFRPAISLSESCLPDVTEEGEAEKEETVEETNPPAERNQVNFFGRDQTLAPVGEDLSVEEEASPLDASSNVSLSDQSGGSVLSATPEGAAPTVSETGNSNETEISLSVLIAGGRVRERYGSESSSGDSFSGSVGSLGGSFNIPLTEEAALPSFINLIDDMLVSVDDFAIICSKLEDPEWRQILYQLTPEEFGLMIAHVNLDHDQPKVAVVVAGQIYSESTFTCHHVILALQNAADWTRASLVQQLLPFCSDLLECHHLLTQELTPWELTVLAGDIGNALSHRT
jgi:hypothetical protein